MGGSNLYFRLYAVDFASRVLERVGRNVNHLANQVDGDGARIDAAFASMSREAQLASDRVTAAAEKQIAALRAQTTSTVEQLLAESEAWAEFTDLNTARQVEIIESEQMLTSQTRHFAMARVAALEEERVAASELQVAYAAMAQDIIASADAEAGAIAATADRNIAKIGEQAAAQRDAVVAQGRALAELQAELQAASMSVAMVGGAMIGASLVGTGAMAVLAEHAAKFDSSLIMSINHAGLLKSELPEITAGILAMAPAVGFGPQALADAFYNVQSRLTSLYSDGLPHTTDKLNILNVAAQLAAVGHADLTSTLKVLMSTMIAYKGENLDAAGAAAQLNAIIGMGDVTMQQFATAMRGGLLPVAADAGVSLKSLGAAYGTLTDAGFGTAQAATYLRSAIIQMTMPAGPATAALTAIGLAGKDVMEQTGAWSDVLAKAGVNQTMVAAEMRKTGSFYDVIHNMLLPALEKSGLTAPQSAALIERAFGGIRSGSGIIGLVNNLAGLGDKEGTIAKAAHNWTEVWKYFFDTDPQGAINRFKSGLDALGVSLGQSLIPVVIQLINWANPLIASFTKWVDKNKALVAQFGPMLVVALALGGAFLAAAAMLGFLVTGLGAASGAAPVLIGLLGATAVVIGGVIAAIKVVRGHWGDITAYWEAKVVPILNTVNQIWKDVSAAFVVFANDVWPKVQAALSAYVDWMTRANGPLSDFIKMLGQAATALSNWVKSPDFATLVAWIATYIPAAIKIAADNFEYLYESIAAAMNAIVGVVKVQNDLSRGDFAAAGRDIKATWSDMTGHIEAGMKAAQNSISDSNAMFSDKTNQQFKDLTSNIELTIANANASWHGAAQSAAHGITVGIDDESPQSTERAERLAASVYKTVSAHQADLRGVGQQMAAGLAAGIQDNQGLIDAIAADAARGALSSAKAAANVSSPSRVWHDELGMMMGAGAAGGLHDSIPMMKAAAGMMVDAAMMPIDIPPTHFPFPHHPRPVDIPPGDKWGHVSGTPSGGGDVQTQQLQQLILINQQLAAMRGSGDMTGGSGGTVSDPSGSTLTTGDASQLDSIFDALNENAYLNAHSYGA